MKTLIRLAVLAGAAGLAALPAWASDSKAMVDAAKAKCEIGETLDGFLKPVDGAAVSAETQRAMDDINLRRQAHYRDLAREQGVTADVVARVTGKKLIEMAGAGDCVKDSDGVWKKK